MHHKRKRPINRRSGCKLCKPWKINGVSTDSIDGEKFSDHKKRWVATEQIKRFDIVEETKYVHET